MFTLFLLACTPDSKPGLGVATTDDPTSPAVATDDLVDQFQDQFCDVLDSCLAPSSGIAESERLAYQGLWEESCVPDAAPWPKPCENPDLDALQDCLDGAWSCDADGLAFPTTCNEICPDQVGPDEPAPVCGVVVERLGNPSEPLVYRPTLRFRFDTVDPDAFVSFEVDGVSYPGTHTWEDEVLVFEPPPLPPGAQVHASVVSCNGLESFDFDTTVSHHGAPLVAPAGGAYTLSLADGTFIEPANLGGLVTDETQRPLFLGIEDHQTTLETVLGESGAASDELLCTGGVGFGNAVFDPDSPWLAVFYPEAYLPRTTMGDSLLVHDLLLTGAFDAEATEIAGITLSGRADTRSLFDDECQALVGPLGIDCVACPDGEQACVDLVITDLTAQYRWWVDDVFQDFLGTCD